MQSIGFIGNEQDINERYNLLTQLYAKKGVSVLKTDIEEQKPNEFETVEELVQNTNLIFFGHNATSNKPLLYHTIKKANRVFLDLQTPLSKSTFLKCKAYQEEAGCVVTFNINPFLIIRSTVPKSIRDKNQLIIRSFSKDSHPTKDIYKFLLFSQICLDCINMRFHVNIIEDEGKVKLINASLTNLKGNQINIFVGGYAQEINQIQIFDKNNLIEKEIPNHRFFNDHEILKYQLDALYNDKQLVELIQGAYVAELIQKIQDKSNQ